MSKPTIRDLLDDLTLDEVAWETVSELAERVEAVLKLHKPIRRTRRTATDSFNWRCPACSTYFRTEHEGCSTIRALEGQS